MNLPNRLTTARLAMAPAFVALMCFPGPAAYTAAFALFLVAAITDYFDGRIARSRNLVTNFGKLMDPLADKILSTAGFIMLMTVPTLDVPAWGVVAILAREFLITGLRSLAAGGGQVIAANWWGKAKAMAQFIYIVVFLGVAALAAILAPLDAASLGWLRFASYWLGAAVAVFTLLSGIQYLAASWSSLRLDDA